MSRTVVFSPRQKLVPTDGCTLKVFLGEVLEDGRWTQHRIAKVRPARSYRPDCPVTTVWLWAELLEMASGGSAHEQGHVCVHGNLKEAEGRR